MGLDMYLYEVKRIEGLKDGDVINPNIYMNLRLLDLKNYRGNKIEYCKTILDNAILVKTIDRRVDRKKIYYDFSDVKAIKPDIDLVAFGQMGYTFVIDGKQKTLTLSEVMHNYSIEEINEYLAVGLEEIYYQRGLSDEGRLLLPGNTEYCDDREKIKELVENGLETNFLRYWEDGKTVFLAWW